jgi:antitoxin CptB
VFDPVAAGPMRERLDGISWRCRRGLLELDLLLGGFWAAHRATLRPEATAAFERLLALPDMAIVDMLHGHLPAGDAELARLIEGLQHFRDVK